MSFITSADAVFTITIKNLFNAPITLENWESDKAWEAQDRNISETKMSIDGKLNIGYIPSPINQTLHFSANSKSLIVFDSLATATEQMRTPYMINGELSLKGLGRKFTFSNGVLVSYAPLPDGGKTLGGRKVTLTWESIIPAGI